MLLKVFLFCGIAYFLQNILMNFKFLVEKRQIGSRLDLISLLPLLLPLILKDKKVEENAK